jgi:hypothetical protein
MQIRVTTATLAATGLAVGFASDRLYFHDLWGTTGFVWAACACGVVFTQAKFISTLMTANYAMGRSMSALVHTLQEAGIEVTEVEAEDDEHPAGKLH